MRNNKVDKRTPLAMLTVEQFMQLMNEKRNNTEPDIQQEKRYVHGLKGIRKLFNVSHATAQRYKDTIIKDAVKQCGRKIIVDVDHAIELFNLNNS